MLYPHVAYQSLCNSQVANEEQKHYVMMDELIQFIAKAEPGSGRWSESAEYNRLDDELYDNYRY